MITAYLGRSLHEQRALLTVTDVHAGYLPGVDILRGLSLEARAERNHAGDRAEWRRQVDAAAHRLRVPPSQPGHHHVPRQVRPAGLRPSDLKAAGISYVTQDINSFPELTVEENLRMGAWVFRRDTDGCGASSSVSMRRSLRLRTSVAPVRASFPAVRAACCRLRVS